METYLLEVAVTPPPSLLEPLQKDERGLLRTLKRILPERRDGQRSELLLVIDQFEELFTLVQNEGARTHFLNSLLVAIGDLQSQLRLVVTLRADFYDRPLQYPAWGDLLRERTELILPLTPTGLEEAITGPAVRASLSIEPGLVSTIIGDVSEQPGRLPLLQYTLTELFEERHGRSLTLASYHQLGGVTGAVA